MIYIYGHLEVGHCFFNGGKNYEKAVAFYQLAANNGSNVALFYLAYCYNYGKGIRKDNSKAFELYKISAENEYIPSQYTLARFYGFGEGVQESKENALKWYKLYQENDGTKDVSD